VNDVELPPWNHGDARRFVLIHRQALESAHARENLPLWIDLVFGYKQTGKAAVEAINVFHPAVHYHFVCSCHEMLMKTTSCYNFNFPEDPFSSCVASYGDFIFIKFSLTNQNEV
jgi:hypothetical protein